VALVLVVTLVGTLMPARRAMRVDPLEAIRAD
jgi:ABC-type lipoprotein release transport system permease subunit